MIYLDNSATTKPCKEAVEAITAALTESWANPSGLYGFGIEAARQLKAARSKVAAALGAEPDRVFFTSGGTEADNWALLSSAKRFGKKNGIPYLFPENDAYSPIPFNKEGCRILGKVVGLHRYSID